MKIKSILEEPNIRHLADGVKQVIVDNGNQYEWEQLKNNHGYNVRFLTEIVSEMMDMGEIYEPCLGFLSVV